MYTRKHADQSTRTAISRQVHVNVSDMSENTAISCSNQPKKRDAYQEPTTLTQTFFSALGSLIHRGSKPEDQEPNTSSSSAADLTRTRYSTFSSKAANVANKASIKSHRNMEYRDVY